MSRRRRSTSATVATGSLAALRILDGDDPRPVLGRRDPGDQVATGLDHGAAAPHRASPPRSSRRQAQRSVRPLPIPPRSTGSATRDRRRPRIDGQPASRSRRRRAPARRSRSAAGIGPASGPGSSRRLRSRAARDPPRTRASNRPSVIRPARSAATSARVSRRSTQIGAPLPAARSIAHEIARLPEPRHRLLGGLELGRQRSRHAGGGPLGGADDRQAERRAHRPPLEAFAGVERAGHGRGSPRRPSIAVRGRSSVGQWPDAPLEPFDAGGGASRAGAAATRSAGGPTAAAPRRRSPRPP